LSLHPKSWLTDDVCQQIIEVWAMDIWQTAGQVRERLAERGIAVAQRVVEEAGRQSGLLQIRARLKEQWVNGADGLCPRDGRYLREHSIVPLVSAQPEVVPK
jgi:hypothetical protein